MSPFPAGELDRKKTNTASTTQEIRNRGRVGVAMIEDTLPGSCCANWNGCRLFKTQGYGFGASVFAGAMLYSAYDPLELRPKTYLPGWNMLTPGPTFLRPQQIGT